MKKPFSWMVLLFFATATLQQCADHGDQAAPEKVQFTCSFNDDGSGTGRTQVDYVPDALIITIETAAGQTYYEQQRLTLYCAGDAYITEPLKLTPGQYRIIWFTPCTQLRDDNPHNATNQSDCCAG